MSSIFNKKIKKIESLIRDSADKYNSFKENKPTLEQYRDYKQQVDYFYNDILIASPDGIVPMYETLNSNKTHGYKKIMVGCMNMRLKKDKINVDELREFHIPEYDAKLNNSFCGINHYSVKEENIEMKK